MRPVQVLALEELVRLRGAFVCARVGAGKTLIAGLSPIAAQIVGLDMGKRPIYFTKAGVLKSTWGALEEASRHWRIQSMSMNTYSQLARDYDGKILGDLKPDLIILDESDACKNTNSGTWHNLAHYVTKVRKEEAYFGEKLIVIAMCGTPTDTSLNQYWHISRLALGENAPVPRSFDEKNQWCAALDEKVTPESRWQPGALIRLSPDIDPNLPEVQRGRLAFGRRLVETPGVITTGESRPENKLHIVAQPLKAPAIIAESIIKMRETRCTPDGMPFETPMDLWRHCRELQCGFFNYWDPAPPTEWLLVRKHYWRLRDDVQGRYRLSTPGHVVKNIMAGAFDKKEPDLVAAWKQWEAIRPTYVYEVKPRWLDDSMVQHCARWLENTKGLLWVEFPALGDALERATGIAYHRQKSLDSQGRPLEDRNRKGPAIASVKSCSYGLNLQYQWHANAYATPMSTNSLWEQSLGRTHRDGQPAPIVTAETWMVCDEAYQSMLYALGRADMSRDTLQQAQKLCYADIRDFSAVERWVQLGDEMWAGPKDATAEAALRHNSDEDESDDVEES